MIKIKNIHYLNMFPEIEETFKKAVERADEGEIKEAFFNLRYTLEGIETELIKNNKWYKARVEVKDKPSSEEIIKRLKHEKIINDKQADLFNAIRRFGNRNVHYDNDINSKQKELETVKNFCARLDNELPSLMAHLGIGGASRKKYINGTENLADRLSSESPSDVAAARRKLQNEIRDYINNPNSYKNIRSNRFESKSSSQTNFKSSNSYTSNNQSASSQKQTAYDELISQLNKEHTNSATDTTNNNASKSRIRKFYESTPVFLIRLVAVLILTTFTICAISNKKASNFISKKMEEFLYSNNKVIKNYSSYDGDWLTNFKYLFASVENGLKDGISLSSIVPNKELVLMNDICKNIKFIGHNSEGSIAFISNQNVPLQLYSDDRIEINIGDKIVINAKQVLNNSSVSSYEYSLVYSKNIALSNGDIITVSVPQEMIDTLDFYNISLKTTSMDITVDGLYDEQIIKDNREDITEQAKQKIDTIMESRNAKSSWKESASIKKIYYVPSTDIDRIYIYIHRTTDRYPDFIGNYQYLYDLVRFDFSANISDGKVYVNEEIPSSNYLLHILWQWNGNDGSINEEVTKDLGTIDNSSNAIIVK